MEVLEEILGELRSLVGLERRREAEFYHGVGAEALEGRCIDAARLALDRCVALGDPYYTPMALYDLADLEKSLGNHDAARKHYENVVACGADSLMALTPGGLGLVYIRLGRLSEAADVMRRWLDQGGRDLVVMENLAEVLLAQQGTANIGAARELADEAVRTASEPKSRFVGHMLRIMSFFLAGRPREGEAAARELVTYLEELGHVPSVTWTFTDIPDLYDRFAEVGGATADAILRAAKGEVDLATLRTRLGLKPPSGSEPESV